ncbi:MAG: class I mannose-6-phosphate isomerase [Verrucomicrobiota bacterium]|nr:class I mannose-6-phosphate isomerase [Verrucomicrobiota bacterium]
MVSSDFQEPLRFAPIFKERIWGGRRLESLYGKSLPEGRIGESWEIVDRPEAQSVIASGSLAGKSLHDLWRDHRAAVFGQVTPAERFPLLVKLLDAEEKLSLQVHPPPQAAADLHGEAKTEFWYIAHATAEAELYVGLAKHSSKRHIEEALAQGTVEGHVHRIRVQTGDAMFLPSGRMHAIGAGNVIVEVQQNSDTTYRVFDWNRRDKSGKARDLHIEESMRSIDFGDFEPELIRPDGELLVRHALFSVEKWTLQDEREISEPGTFAIVVCLTGEVACAGVSITPGNFLLVPAAMRQRELEPRAADSSLLRITIPR